MYYNNYNNVNVNSYNNPSNRNVAQILTDLQNLVIAAETNEIGPMEIIKRLKAMEALNELKIIGEGTNRIAVQVNRDMSTFISFVGECIIKIPHSGNKGMNDNMREFLLYHTLLKYRSRGLGEQDLAELISTLPVMSRVQGFPYLIAQEKITPIQASPEIANGPNHNIINRCTDLIMSNTYRGQYIRLIELLDKYTVFGDLDPVTTPLQYGFKNVNGMRRLTVLDTGYTIPKFSFIIGLMSKNIIVPRHYLIVGKDITLEKINDNGVDKLQMMIRNSALKLKESDVSQFNTLIYRSGMYYASNPNTVPYIITDMEYFMGVMNQVRQSITGFGANIDDDMILEYFAMLAGRKF